MDVTLGKLRTMQVFILGDVVRPAATPSRRSPPSSTRSTTREAPRRAAPCATCIIRRNQVYQHADLYGYILTGSKAGDVRLQSGDVVFVPPVGKQAAVVGEVHRPAIYELAPGEGLQDLLKLCGGVLTTAVVDYALIDRVVPFAARDSLAGQDRIVVDVPLRSVLADEGRRDLIHDRDILQVYRIGDTRKNSVAITGRLVIRPGVYQWRPQMRMTDLVKEAGGLDPDAYMDRAQIFRPSSATARAPCARST